jgi:hypothetical protein
MRSLHPNAGNFTGVDVLDSIDGAAARLFNFSSAACWQPDLMIMTRIAFASLAALLMSANAAAQQEQQQKPQQECFAVVMNNTASLGSILIDKCAGKTWLLARVNVRDRGYTVRWHPITVETTEPVSSGSGP